MNPTIGEICSKRGISPAEFFSAKRGALSDARREAAQIFRERGVSWEGTARLLKCNRDTVRYWFDDDFRRTKNARNLKHWHEKVKQRRRIKTKRRIETEESRREILQAHWRSPREGRELAMSRGLSYAYSSKLAWIHRKANEHENGCPTVPRNSSEITAGQAPI